MGWIVHLRMTASKMDRPLQSPPLWESGKHELVHVVLVQALAAHCVCVATLSA